MKRYFMLCISVFFGLLPLLAGAISAQEATTDFGRYEVILQRQPFGMPPARPEASQVSAIPAEDPFKNYRVVGITRGADDDISVGVVDLGANPPASIFLNIGDSDGGITLIDADYDLEGALIRKDMNEKWLYLGGASPAGGGMAQDQVSYEADAARSSRGGASRGIGSYVERMRERRAALRTTIIEPPKISGEDLKKHLQEYNMELIRKAVKGESEAPPLPIQLTPEQDRQLVEEGVLPPQ